jgi:hypothetical protein
MRRAFCAVLATAALALVVPGAAQAFDAPGICGTFGVIVNVVSSNESSPPAVFPPSARLPGGILQLESGTSLTTGSFVESFQNDVTLAPPIVRNVSGPNWVTFDPATGSGTFVGTGQNAFTFGPLSQANTGEPGLVFTNGLVVLQFTGNVVTSFSLSGTQINGCALLAG